ncbi:MAG: hypothetical protein HYV42_05225 [Candidatus Magasanikbacteria bacterium]|nr:hypothetical protein [Candidatus Magasanikbacteria bacterium]
MLIIPAILALTFDEFTAALERVGGLAPYLHLDVMDGVFVPHRTFPERERLNELPLPDRSELHLMVADPAAEIKRWQGVRGVFRALVQVEANNPAAGVAAAQTAGWEAGLVLNPKTPLSAADPFLSSISIKVLQFMTVAPGAQGQAFHPEVKAKIAAFTARPGRPRCAVDGAVDRSNIRELRDLGVEIANVGHGLLQAHNPRQEYAVLQTLVA